MVERNEFYLIQKSPLTAATKFNLYFYMKTKAKCCIPTTITSDIKVSYIKKPAQINGDILLELRSILI